MTRLNVTLEKFESRNELPPVVKLLAFSLFWGLLGAAVTYGGLMALESWVS